MGKEVIVKYNGQEHKYIVKSMPYTALDDLWVEDRKHVYLSLVGVTSRDETMLRKARWLATFELVVESGIQLPKIEAGQSMDPILVARMKAQAVGSTPPSVVNDVVEEYFAQFESIDEAKN